MKGLVIQLLNHLSEAEGKEAQDREAERIGALINLSQMTVISEKSLYKRRRLKQDFAEGLAPEEETEELSGEEILRLNRIRNRYSRKEINEFILERMEGGRLEVKAGTVSTEEDFEKLVLAYDNAIRKDSPYRVREEAAEMVENGRFRYPGLIFERKGHRG